MRIWVVFINLILFSSCRKPKLELEGPELILQPSPVTHFSNSFGLTLECLGRGPPPITNTWLTRSPQIRSDEFGSEGIGWIPVSEIRGLREILKNDSLHFNPFSAEDYLSGVHDSEYRCLLTNPIGSTLSTIFSVHAIIDQPFEIFITGPDEENVIEGSPTELSCDVSPVIYKDFVRTVKWKTIDQYGHESDIESNDETMYQISSRGSLVIFTAKYQQIFLCFSKNMMTNKIQSSSPFLLKSKAGVGGLLLKIVGKWERIKKVAAGNPSELLCLVVGMPSPNFRWEKFVGNKFVPVVSVENRGRIRGPLLSFDRVDTSQNGTYRCEVSSSNTFETLSLILDLIVSSVHPLIELEPKKRTVRTGQNVELECKIPNGANHAEITWFRNGKSLTRGDRLEISSAGKLSIFNIKYDEQGVYQCFTRIDDQHIGGTGNLVFESSEPELLHTFINNLVQPGTSVSLKCSAIGNPIPVFSWFVDDRLIELPSTAPDNNNRPYNYEAWRESHHRYSAGSHFQLNEIVTHVNISAIRVEDSGVYKCVASNLVSSNFHSARLNVYGGLFIKEMMPKTHVAGQVALIPCLYGGYPVDRTIWKHNGSDIETKKNKSRFKVLPNGTLQIDNIKPETDKGLYSCFVSNRKSEKASGTVSINVLRPPVISSFSFDDNLQEGQRTSLSCNVVSGDLDDITWIKDLQPIPSSLNITAMRVKFLSTLIFEEVKAIHAGTYTCLASTRDLATVSFSAHLTVRVPPKWVYEPSELSRGLLKSDHIIQCGLAEGYPKPTIRWFRESGGMRTAIRSDQKHRILENGSLVILDVEEKDEANITCEVTNGVGNGIQKSILLSVITPAKVSAPLTSVVVAEGLAARIECLVRGNRPIGVVWRKNSIVIEHSPRLVLQTVLDANSSVLSAELKIERSERSDTGKYFCFVSNKYGRDEVSISLHVKARPQPPEDFIVEEIGSRIIRLKWSLNPENLSTNPVTQFILQYKNSSAISWDGAGLVNNISVQAPATQTVLRFLSPVTNYEIRILACNEIGCSLPNHPISVATLAEAPSGPVLNVTAIPTSSKSVLVTWEQPSLLLQNGAILGYHVIVTHASINPLSNNTILIDEKWGHQTEIKDLRPNSRYHISIRGYNVAGVGPESPFVSINTPEGSPDSPPLNILCEALSPKSLQILWEPPPAKLSNGIIQGYKVIYLPVAAERLGEKPEVKKTINKETTLHGLSSYTNYSVRTLAYTLGGESSTSDPIFCITEEDFPEEPADIKVLASGSNSVGVSWLPPKVPNGIITKYKISWKSDDPEGVKEKYYIPSMDEEQMFMEVRRLKESKRYSFWITAATSLGMGTSSKIESVVVTSKAPAQIVSFPVTRRPKLDQTVLLPCRALGWPLPEITWIKGSLSQTSNHIMRNGSLFISRVKDSDQDVFTCIAQNSFGRNEIQHEIFISKPPSAVLLVLGYVTLNSVQIHWDLPLRADPPLSGFILQYRAGNGLDWTSKRLTSRLTSFAIENLLCGTSYHIRLAAENQIGLGEFSPLLKTKTNGSPPEYPRLTEVLDGNGTMVRIDLRRWPDGGCSIKRFHIEYKTKESYEWKRIHKKDNNTRLFILNTALNSKYDVRISVENEAGSVSKTFSVESSTQFFTNYDKLTQNGIERTDDGFGSAFTDPHIIVPVISAIICLTAFIICILIVVKRKTAPKEEWKLGQSSSQQTWLSSEDFRVEKSTENNKLEEHPGNSGMSIYATLNSRKPIPMTIRDSTVRFQTFGQVENYDANLQPFYCKTRGNSNSSSSHEELVIQEGFAINHPKPRERRDSADYRQRRISNPNEYIVEDICHEYAHPYQVVPHNRGQPGPSMNDETLGGNTLKRKKHGKRSRHYIE